MDRYICIHGHFYQPPRENAWLESIEQQDSAYPYHDWNERITAECYATNAASRILDNQDRIKRIVNNYSRISFNFGPTLLSWMEEHAEPTYRAIQEADARSRERYRGHGSALAQAYNHMILPLANRRDKECQVHWGVRDFEHRFGRKPEGMWLPETAVDLESLEVLADHGIQFTLLAPGQAARVRLEETRRWRDVSGGRVDPTTPYLVRLPSRRDMPVFFYDGPISQGVAFERLLDNGETFARRLLGAFFDQRPWTQLVHIATDGETYGHHHRYGEMALSYALDYIETNRLAQLTNYGAFLETHPPMHLVELVDNSSWSCIHGVERWRADCGCCTGGHPTWNQSWRAPLREALDWLRDRLATVFEKQGRPLLTDPWAARTDYIEVLLDPSPESRQRFLARHATRELSAAERVRAWKLLELQRHAMLMYTSCGWFFDELSGIETVQVIQYAARALQLAAELDGADPEPEFLERLSRAKSNLPERGDGRQVYEQLVRPAVVDLLRVGAHFAVSVPFRKYDARSTVYGYTIERDHDKLLKQGKARLAVGRLNVTSRVTEERVELSYGVLHLGDHNLTGGVREYRGEASFDEMVGEVTRAFDGADLPEALRILDRHFESLTYSLRSLFRDERRSIINTILESTVEELSRAYLELYEEHVPLMRFLAGLNIPLPDPLRAAGELILNRSLREAIEAEPPDVERVGELLREAQRESIKLDRVGLGFALQKAMEREMRRLGQDGDDGPRLRGLIAAADLAHARTLDVNLWNVENHFYGMLEQCIPEMRTKRDAGDEATRVWLEQFVALGESLRIRVD